MNNKRQRGRGGRGDRGDRTRAKSHRNKKSGNSHGGKNKDGKYECFKCGKAFDSHSDARSHRDTPECRAIMFQRLADEAKAKMKE